MYTLEELKTTHADYDKNTKLANYLYSSYVGGEQYKTGAYLTRYIGENAGPGDQYLKRIASTPLDNHVQTTVDIYRSFLFRTTPQRNLGTLANNPLVNQWIYDTDQDGQSMDSFLKTANDLAMVTGGVWILVDKGVYKVDTEADAIALNIRAYAATYTPQNVLDWYYERDISGKPTLKYIKVIETENTEYAILTTWTSDMICKYKIAKDDQGNLDHIVSTEEYPNPLEYIPFIFHAPLKSPTKGIGYSIVADVANHQKFIYNCLSEIEQTIRISSHPSLVKTPSTDAHAGAGGIVSMQEDLDPGLKPYLLTPSGSTVDSILKTIDNSVQAIQRMTHTSAIQATQGSPISGIALQTERQLLNAKLSDIADTIKETEYQMWIMWLDWQALTMPTDFTIEYSDTFDMRDEFLELDFLLKTRSSGVNTPSFQNEISKQIISLTVDDPELQQKIFAELDGKVEPHIMVSPQGEEVLVTTQSQHEDLMALGYSHVE